MPSANDVAVFLARTAAQSEEPDPLTHLRLQKLLYYVQGWSLVLRTRPAFDGHIEAWAHGPVVPSVYKDFKKFGDETINVDPEVEVSLDDADREFVSSVWEEYSQFSAGKLRAMTHEESPWKDARKGYDPGERCNMEITHDALVKHFKTLIRD